MNKGKKGTMIMRKYLMVLAVALAVTTTGNSAPQSHRHTPRTQADVAVTADEGAQPAATAGSAADETGTTGAAAPQSPATGKNTTAGRTAARKTQGGIATVVTSGNGSGTVVTDDGDGGVEAYSDTTMAAGPDTAGCSSMQFGADYDISRSADIVDSVMRMGNGLIFTAVVLIVLFVLSPLGILALIFYFIYKSRKQKLQLAEMAIKNGQPLPDDLLARRTDTDAVLWQKGIKHVFLGAGLIVLFWFMDMSIGIGVGFLIVFYGAGQAVIARTTAGGRGGRRGPDDADDNVAE